MTEWAALEEDVFQAPDRAVTIYRRILEVAPHAWRGACARSHAFSRRRAISKGRSRSWRRIAICAREPSGRRATSRSRELDLRLKKPAAALAAAKQALDVVKHQDGPIHQAAIGVVEELLTVGETRAAAAVILDEAYGETGQLARQAEVLEVRIATTAAREDRSALYMRLAGVHEKLGALGVAFDVVARAAREFPSELPLWDRLAVLAQRTKRSHHFVAAIADAVPPMGETGLPVATELDLSERAATLYEEALGEPERARPYLERVLARDPTNDRAFGRLKQILTSAERWGELEELYERAVRATGDNARKTELLSEIALVAEEINGDKPKATSFYERILELEPKHEQSLRALDALYAAQERWAELARLLEKRVSQAAAGDARAFKLRLGALRFSQLGDSKQALDELEDVLEADPASREAREIVEKCLELPPSAPARPSSSSAYTPHATTSGSSCACSRSAWRASPRWSNGASSSGESRSSAINASPTTPAPSTPTLASYRSRQETTRRASGYSRSRTGRTPTSAPPRSSSKRPTPLRRRSRARRSSAPSRPSTKTRSKIRSAPKRSTGASSSSIRTIPRWRSRRRARSSGSTPRADAAPTWRR